MRGRAMKSVRTTAGGLFLAGVIFASAACGTPPAPPEPSGWAAGTCWNRNDGDGRSIPPQDLRLTGAANTPENLTPFTSTDGTCGGDQIRATFTTVQAADLAAATGLCDGLVVANRIGDWGGQGVTKASDVWSGSAPDAWVC